ncbi:MAG: Chaperone SurA precursor [Bacteroidetes bacterium ADurb.Bin123]|nr:MAG: Chaperone SurA precursor [Bacteroidetes bacterium ADurb.Bin123]
MKLNNAKYGILIILFILLFFRGNFPAVAQDRVVDQIIAVVGNNIILKSEIEEMFKQQQAQGITSEGDMKCEILEDFLIDKLLVAEALLDTNIIVTDNQINQNLDGRLQMFITHFGSEKEVENYFKKSIPELKSELQEVIRNQLLSSQMQGKILENVTATPSEVRLFYRNLKDEDIPEIPVQYEYRQITVVPEIDPEEDNRVKAQLREYKRRVEEGANFATLAVLYSEAPEQRFGGEIGYKGRAELDPAYAAAAFNLKDDKISNVVKSEFGYHIIQLIDRKGEKINTRHILMRPKIAPEALEKASLRLDSLGDLIRKQQLTFENAAMMFSHDKITRNNGGLMINPESLSSRFSIESLDPDISKVITTMKVNEISDPFQTIDENSKQTVYKIIKLVNKAEGHKANLQEDYQQLAELYLNKKKQQVLEEWIARQQAKTYIRIDNTYANCNFKFSNWIK